MLFEEACGELAEERRILDELSRDDAESRLRPLGGISQARGRGRGGRGGRFSRARPPSELVAEIDAECALERALVDSVNVAADTESEELVRRAEAKANLLRDFPRGLSPPTPKTVRFSPGF